MTPDAIEAKYFVRPERYRDKAALVGETSDNLPGVPGVGDKTAAKWISEYGGLDGIVANVDKIKGKAGESLRAHLADVLRNYELNALVCDLELPLRPAGRAVARLGPRGGAPGLRRARVPGAARAAVLVPRRGRARGRVRLRPGRQRAAAPARWPAGSASTPAAARSVWRSPAASAAAPASSPASRWPPATARPPGSTRPAWTRTTSARSPRGWPTRTGPRSSTTPSRRCWRSARTAGRWPASGCDTALAAYLAKPDQRAYDLTDLALRYLKRELRVDAPEDGQLTLDGLGDDGAAVEQNVMLRARATLDLADTLTEELSRDDGASQRLLVEVEQPLAVVLGEMEHVGIAADTEYLSELEAHFAAEVKSAAAGRARGGRPRVQPGLAQAAAGDPVHRARAAQDQADQVRLHHRRRRAAEPVRADRRPGARAPAAAPRRGQAEVHGGRPAQVGLRRRPHPHHVQPDRRRDRPAVVHRPEPAEHPDPHRGGPADPPRVHRRRRASSS